MPSYGCTKAMHFRFFASFPDVILAGTSEKAVVPHAYHDTIPSPRPPAAPAQASGPG
jgi:hypothetical protein